MAEIGTCATAKNLSVYVNNQLFSSPQHSMARVKSRKSRARHFTPPSNLIHLDKRTHPKTPSRCGVFYAKAFSQELGILIPQSIVRKVTGMAPRSQTRILASKQVRTIHNQPDSGPDPRGRKCSKCCTTEKASLARFTQIFEKEMEQKTIQRMYNSYTKRFHDCRRAGGQMTKY